MMKNKQKKTLGIGTKASYPVGFAQGLWSKLTSPISVSDAEGHFRLLSPVSWFVRHRGRRFAQPQITPSAEDRLSVSSGPAIVPKIMFLSYRWSPWCPELWQEGPACWECSKSMIQETGLLHKVAWSLSQWFSFWFCKRKIYIWR